MYKKLITEHLDKLECITAYPSILTYHNLDERGDGLVDSLVEDQSFSGPVFITEKIDGANTRGIIFTDDNGFVVDYVVGSRKELLYAFGDRIVVESQRNQIYPMRDAVEQIMALSDVRPMKPNHMYVIYGETYGGRMNGWKQYSTSQNALGLRFFDMWSLPTNKVFEIVEDSTREQISNWKKRVGQPFVSVYELGDFCNRYDLVRVPYIQEIDGSEIPTSLQGVWEWMQRFKNSVATLDDSGRGMSEGIVVRYADRSLIRKIRFSNYEASKRKGRII